MATWAEPLQILRLASRFDSVANLLTPPIGRCSRTWSSLTLGTRPLSGKVRLPRKLGRSVGTERHGRSADEGGARMVAGVDGTRRGWIAVLCDEQLKNTKSLFMYHLAELPRDLGLVAVDIPIGLPRSGPRKADTLARERLGQPRGRSVFPCPVRSALDAREWKDACVRAEGIDGRRVTKQSFGIFPKIREVDLLLRTQCWARRLIREVHPELSFALWAGTPMKHRKKSALGRIERQELIAAAFGENAFGLAQESVRGHGVASDDLADAFAAAWTASRILGRTASLFPGDEEVDDVGLAMQICA
jgi:predicted RNase H-like nuclease